MNFCHVQHGPERFNSGRAEMCGSETIVKPGAEGSVSRFEEARSPTAHGKVNGKPAVVLRDTGCTAVVVRESLVKPHQYVEDKARVTMIDESERHYKMANVEVESPFLSGTVMAIVMPAPMYDLVVGNVEGSRLPDISHFNAQEVTCSHGRATERVSAPMTVADKVLDVSKREFEDQQRTDKTLTGVRVKVLKGEQVHYKGRRKAVARFTEKGRLLYREYRIGKKVYDQLVVPRSLREMVMRLTCESITAGQLSADEVISRVRREFFWLGMNRDITRYCQFSTRGRRLW